LLTSAIIMLGLPTSAIAIITLCFIPPLSSRGYWLYLLFPSEIPTIFNISKAFSFDFFLLYTFLWTNISSIYFPIFIVGFNEVIGSWNINPISTPLIFLISLSDIFVISLPLYFMEPFSKNPGGSELSLTKHCAVTLFPQPDSPTIPTISPSHSLLYYNSMRSLTELVKISLPSFVINIWSSILTPPQFGI